MNSLNSNNRKHLDKEIPMNLIEDTKDIEDMDSLLRYLEIINILVIKYKYKIIEHTVEDNLVGFINKWVLVKIEETELNKDMDKQYNINHEYCLSERLGKTYRNLDFSKLKPSNWMNDLEGHKRIDEGKTKEFFKNLNK